MGTEPTGGSATSASAASPGLPQRHDHLDRGSRGVRVGMQFARGPELERSGRPARRRVRVP